MAQPKPEADRQRHRQIVQHSPDLVDLLDALYPARAPSLTDSEREVWAKAGERRLVERLLILRAEALRDIPTLLGG